MGTHGRALTVMGRNVCLVQVPNTLSLEVVETDPGVKGNTASGGDKVVSTSARARPFLLHH